MRGKAWLTLVGMLVVGMGCGDAPPTPSNPDLGGLRDLGRDVGEDDLGTVDGGPDAGDDDLGTVDGGMGECSEVGAPTVAFVGALASAGPHIFADNFVATCQLSEGDEALALDTLSIVVTNELGVRVQDINPVSGTLPDSWEGPVGAGGLPAGAYRVRCYVEDSAGACGVQEQAFSVDGGPVVTIQTPEPNQPFAGGMTARYTVQADELFPDDTGASVVSTVLTVAGARIPSASITDLGNGSYQANINFANTSLFPLPLAGGYLMSVDATNTRGASSRSVVAFIVDSQGPEITFLTPGNGELVGGVFSVRVHITDPLGVVAGSTVTVGDDVYTLVPIPNVADEYLQTIDANGFGISVRELTINVVAQDLALNGRVASRTVKLDSQPPIASLDPGPVRHIVSGTNVCSQPLDPVGADSANDRQVLGTAAEFRARGEDRANIAFGGSDTVEFLAGIPVTAGLSIYVLDDTTMPLLVDSNGDGVCDRINPLVDPEEGATSNAAVVIDLTAISPWLLPSTPNPAGSGVYWPLDPGLSLDPVVPACDPLGYDAPPPPAICGSTDLTWVMESRAGNSVPTIFGKPPILPSTCTGDSWDFQTSIRDGWACVAIRTRDNVGNVGVSAPMRNCFVRSAQSTACGGVPVGSYMPNGPSVPRCTDGCTPPPGFTAASGFNVVEVL